MFFPVSSSLQMLLCTFLAFVALANAIAPVPIAKPVPQVPNLVPVIPEPVPVVPKHIAPRAVIPGSQPKPNTPKTPKTPNQNTGNKGGNVINKVGGSRNGEQTLPKLVELPRPQDEMIFEDDESVFSLGSYREGDREQALFENFDGPELPFYSKMYGFFAAKESYLPTENPYAEATGKQNPFPSGYRDRPQGKRMTVTAKATAPTDHMVTQTFTPTEATDACSIWSSLRSYCGNAGQDCACKSGSYWVPDQWNSLAKGCARATTKCSGMDVDDDVWCRLGRTAGDYSTYCADEPTMGAAVTAKFAELADVGADATPTADSDPEPTSVDPEPTSDDPETSSEAVDATPTIFSSNTPIFAQTTSEPTTSFYVSFTPTTTFAPAGSSSSRSLNPVIASTFAWISLLTAIIII